MQFDCILIQYFIIPVMFRKMFDNKLHKGLSYICFDMSTAWRVKPVNFSCSYTFNYCDYDYKSTKAVIDA